jgi:3-oxoadipate enol-lactonase
MFLHGAGGNHLSWWQQAPVFAEEYRCVTVDQRGFGQSPDVAGGPGPAALATDALALLDHLHIRRAALVRQSMGGWAACGAAVRAPERFWAIVLAQHGRQSHEPEIAARQSEAGLPRARRGPPCCGTPPWPHVPPAQPVRSFLYAQIAGVNAPRRRRLQRKAQPSAPRRWTSTPRRGPTLFLTSDEDGLIWPELSQKVHQHVPGSRFERVEAPATRPTSSAPTS